jgi:hypothetical protein
MRLWPCFVISVLPRYPADQWLRMRRLKKLSPPFFGGVLIFLSFLQIKVMIYVFPVAFG